jgi:predicted permease
VLPADQPTAVFRVVSQDYFRALGIPLLGGRSFTAEDTADAQPAMVINRTMAERFWPGQDVIGKRFKIGPSDSSNPWSVIVGVVGDVRQTRLDQELKPEMYVSYLQDRRFFAMPRDLVVRTTGDPLSMAASVRREIWKLDPDLPLFSVQTMDQILSLSVAGQRFNLLLMTLFAGLALILASVGIYGVMSYMVAQRTHEIGIRCALGARRRDVLKLVLGQGLRLTIIGVIVGVVGAYALTRVMMGLLFDVSATDPLTFAAVATLLTAVSLLACYIPARRAIKVDPMIALRYE